MKYEKTTIRDAEVFGKRILLRCDFNVPLDKESGEITSDKRIVASIPTIKYLLERGGRVIVCSHLGKPKGEVKPELSLKIVANRLSELLGMPVAFAADVAGQESKRLSQALENGQIMLIENLRFDPDETKNDPDFARRLSELAELYVSDAFGTVHRAHASTVGVASYLPAYAGFLVEKELSVMGKALEAPRRPFVAILGGSKVSDKIGVISNLIDKADTILIGGGMSYTFMKAMGLEVGKSLMEADKITLAKELIEKAKAKGTELVLPMDYAIGSHFAPDCEKKIVSKEEIPADWMGLDIGGETIKLYQEKIKTAGTVIWNGPMGVFEFPAFADGTNAVAKALSESDAVTIVGGGDSAAAVEQMGYADKMTHISTGGGASLGLLEGRELAGIACLPDK
ncbi:MAG: phosphoglycerate kinase [Clostridiales bacterium]|nr:phosphoglycerate kinase [Clostridiales bacterium]